MCDIAPANPSERLVRQSYRHGQAQQLKLVTGYFALTGSELDAARGRMHAAIAER